MKSNQYVTPEFKVVIANTKDVITTSGETYDSANANHFSSGTNAWGAPVISL